MIRNYFCIGGPKNRQYLNVEETIETVTVKVTEEVGPVAAFKPINSCATRACEYVKDIIKMVPEGYTVEYFRDSRYTSSQALDMMIKFWTESRDAD